MNIKEMTKKTLLATALFGGAMCLAEGTDQVKAEVTSNKISIDNLENRVASGSETLVMPLAWGDTNTPTLTVAGAVTTNGTNCVWNTAPLMPDLYLVELKYGTTCVTSLFTVAALDSECGMASIDNAYDSDKAGSDIRDIANHTNRFALTWPGASSASLTLDGTQKATATGENASYDWNTNGCTYAIYTFTNKVDGTDYVARFRVHSDIAVKFGDLTNDVLVASTWQYLPDAAASNATKQALSDMLKVAGDNGLALWKSYVLGVSPDTTVGLKSNIAVTNLTAGKVEVTVWPADELDVNVVDGSQATVDYAIQRADALEGTPNWTPVKNLVSAGDLRYIETNEATQVKRFYRTSLDVSPTPKNK